MTQLWVRPHEQQEGWMCNAGFMREENSQQDLTWASPFKISSRISSCIVVIFILKIVLAMNSWKGWGQDTQSWLPENACQSCTTHLILQIAGFQAHHILETQKKDSVPSYVSNHISPSLIDQPVMEPTAISGRSTGRDPDFQFLSPAVMHYWILISYYPPCLLFHH